MKIALYGNVCNNMFAIAKALRDFSNHEAHLYLPEKSDFHNLPENDYPELRNNYPDWIHKDRAYNLEGILRFWQNNVIKELDRYDLVVLSSLSVALSPFLKKCKIFFFVTGGDLTVLPFKEIHRTLCYSGKNNNLKPIVYQWIQRRGIKKVHKILTQPFSPFINAAKKLNIPESKIADAYLPIMIDTQKFQYRPNAQLNLNNPIQRQLKKFSFKIFHPSRIMINPHPHLVETGQWKHNDLLVKAFAEFVKKNKVKDAGIYLIDRCYSSNRQINEFKKLIEDQGIKDFVVWLRPENKNGFTRNELVDIYSCCDLIADDFGAGWFGSICVEGFSCSRPVLSYVDNDAMNKIYRWHPFLSSCTLEGNIGFITKCYYDKEFSITQGNLGRKWALEYHSLENAAKLYAKELERLLADANCTA